MTTITEAFVGKIGQQPLMDTTMIRAHGNLFRLDNWIKPIWASKLDLSWTLIRP